MQPMGTRGVVLVNNSRETFTPTVSGAIATCLWEVARAAAEAGHMPTVLTRGIDADPYPWPRTRILAIPERQPPAPHTPPLDRAPRIPALRSPLDALRTPLDRAVRRATGWPSDRRAYARAVLRVLAAHPPRTVVCNNDPELAVLLSRRLPNTRVLHWFHNLELTRDRWRRAYLGARVRSVAVSAYLARAVEQAYHLEPGYVRLAPNGVDATRFRPAKDPGRASWGNRPAVVPPGVGLVGPPGAEPEPPHAGTAPKPGTDPVVLSYLGRLAPEKAPDLFLRAALLLAARGHDIGVQLLGDTNWGRHEVGPYATQVHELHHRLTAAGVKVHAPGHVAREDVPAELRRAHVHVVPSAWDEPFGLTTLEGMASGLAVVATATGGTPEIVTGAGTLVPRGDADALADALAALITDPRRLEADRHAARARAESFTWARTWAALAAAESSALTARGAP